jgi:hypothetical protein
MKDGIEYLSGMNHDTVALGGIKDQPIVTDEKSHEFNAPYICSQLINQVIKKS